MKQQEKRERIKWIDKLRARLKVMLSLDVSPHKMAMSCALGILAGINPYIGLQTYIAITLASIFKLPLYPILAGVYITNPITIPFIFAFTTNVGMWLLNMDVTVDVDWQNLNLRYLYETGKVLLLPFFIGTHFVGFILSVPTYFITYFIMKRYKRGKAREES
ncbi:MAG: DUF2062 domain-containing protein [Deferribacteraceae bacterium]|nr:DUF2062 domain-containing protein [Deferribacteraceae bacterium]